MLLCVSSDFPTASSPPPPPRVLHCHHTSAVAWGLFSQLPDFLMRFPSTITSLPHIMISYFYFKILLKCHLLVEAFLKYCRVSFVLHESPGLYSSLSVWLIWKFIRVNVCLLKRWHCSPGKGLWYVHLCLPSSYHGCEVK